MTRTQTVVIMGLVVLALLVGLHGDAHACTSKTICVKVPILTEDHVVGDLPAEPSEPGWPLEGWDIEWPDLSEAYLPATHARVRFIPPPPEPARSVILDEEGCFTFDSEYWTGFKLLVYPEAYLGQNAGIHLMVFDNFTDYYDAQQSPEEAPALRPWLIHVNGVLADDVVFADLEGSSDMATMFAYAAFTLDRLDKMTDTGLTDAVLYAYTQVQLDAMAEGDVPGVSGGAANGGYAHKEILYLNQGLVKKKFTIAHEIGHWFALNWDATDAFSTNYTYQDDKLGAFDNDCKFAAIGANSSHGIRSAEHEPAALNEGFAQYISALTFDDATLTADATFKYYKLINTNIDVVAAAYDDFINEDYYQVSLIGGNPDALGGQSAWVENECNPEWNQHDVTSELDWMRMLWQFQIVDVEVGGSPTPKPSLSDILEMLQLAESEGYAGLRAEVCDSANTEIYPYCGRFDELVTVNGVFDVD